MPDEPREGDTPEPKDEDLDAEMAEFEAGLAKAVGPIPERKRPDLSRLEETEQPAIPNLPTDEEIEERLSRAIKDAEKYLGPISIEREDTDLETENAILESPRISSKFDSVDEEFDARIREFDGRAKTTIGGRKKQATHRRKLATQDGESARGLGEGITVAYAIIGFPLIGAGVGWFLAEGDQKQTAMGVGVVVGMVIGVSFGLFLLNRFQSRK